METEREGEETICYPARGAWCATCPSGHCDPENGGQTEEEFDYSDSTPDDVSSGQSWGFCEPHCFRLQTEELQQRKLEEKTVRVRREPGRVRELSASHWTELSLPLYRPAANSTFQQVGSSQLLLWGGSGSCQADQGGPLFVTEGGRARLIGLASRGRDCATNNSRGIFVRSVGQSVSQSVIFICCSESATTGTG